MQLSSAVIAYLLFEQVLAVVVVCI